MIHKAIGQYGKLDNKFDKNISIAIMSTFGVLTVQYFLLIYFNLIETETGQFIQLASKGVVGFFYLLALPAVLKRNKVKFFTVYYIAILIFLFNFILFKKNSIHLKSIIFPFFFTCLPSFIYAYSIEDWNILMGIMKKSCNIVFVIGTLIGILVLTGTSSIGSYSMSLSYYMLLPTIIYTNEFLDNISIKYVIFSGVSLLIILALGSRGAVMCLMIFAILKFIKKVQKISKKSVILYFLVLFTIIIGIIFLYEILEYIYKILLSYEINSRTIRLFLRDGIHLSGRERIYTNIIREIVDKPLLGIGLAGDRRILYGRDAYVHNIFIEIVANYGIVLGVLINIFLIFLLIKTIISKNIRNYNMLITWTSIGFAHLLVSSSYLTDFKFWIYLGLALKGVKLKIYRRNNVEGEATES